MKRRRVGAKVMGPAGFFWFSQDLHSRPVPVSPKNSCLTGAASEPAGEGWRRMGLETARTRHMSMTKAVAAGIAALRAACSPIGLLNLLVPRSSFAAHQGLAF